MDQLNEARRLIDETDREIARLFQRRMAAVEQIADYKRRHGLPISDPGREAELLARTAQNVDPGLRSLYMELQQCMMTLSRRYQQQLGGEGNAIRVDLGPRSYNVIAERGCLSRAAELLELRRRVLIVTDEGVPPRYARALADQCPDAHVVTVPQGEGAKCFPVLERVLRTMSELGMTRGDCVAAVGGGAVGDLAGLAAALYMRGVDFYNIPTTLLSQVDSSVGGKTAIDMDGVKNPVGAFHQPRRVLLDFDLLDTLPRRHLSAGLAEALKLGVTLDPALFELFEKGDPFSLLPEIITRSVALKARIVEADERESDKRRVLNFGHTIGHAIESTCPQLLHGECVALGMLPMCSDAVRQRLLPIYEKLALPSVYALDSAAVMDRMRHDKKRVGDELMAVEAPEIGAYVIRAVSPEELERRLACITEGAETA